MSFTNDQLKALKAPLDRANVATRSQSGRELSYIEGYHAENEANRIFGFDKWDTEEVWTRCVSERERKIGAQGRDGWSVSYTCKVRVTVRADGDLVVREGVGAGHGIDVDLGLAHESAIKEAATDAEKRALKTFGNQFGLALYDKSQSNVATMPQRKSSAQAKRDGDHERILGLIQSHTSEEVLDLWYRQRFDEETKDVPFSWLDPLRNEVEKWREAIRGGEFRQAPDGSISGRVPHGEAA